MRRPLTTALLALAALAVPRSTAAYFADWSSLTRDREPLCISIPSNMSLCQNIGYTKMRLPNLLDHDTTHEASDQARSFLPLLNVHCHPDTQLFLCSLFAPVCLDRPIYPCRSLCNKVRAGCLPTMTSHGYPWPKMLQCDKFPVDNDMCITSQSDKSAGKKDGGSGGDDGGRRKEEKRRRKQENEEDSSDDGQDGESREMMMADESRAEEKEDADLDTNEVDEGELYQYSEDEYDEDFSYYDEEQYDDEDDFDYDFDL